MKLLFPAACLVLLIACNNNETKTTAVVNTVHATEEAAIKKAVADAYTCISFKQGEQPKYDAVKNYFVPQAQFFNFRNDSLEYFTIDQFAAAYKEFITSNKIGSFYEEEVSGTTEQFGRIAQRISTYKTFAQRANPEKTNVNMMDSISERGVNSFQLVKTAQGWKVTSIIWDVESAKLPIPAYYLKPDSAK